MAPELPPNGERKRTLYRGSSSERLLALAGRTTSLLVIDYLCDLFAERFEATPSPENKTALEYVIARQKAMPEINQLNADYKAPDNEEVALIEEINEALFRPLQD